MKELQKRIDMVNLIINKEEKMIKDREQKRKQEMEKKEKQIEGFITKIGELEEGKEKMKEERLKEMKKKVVLIQDLLDTLASPKKIM